MAAADQRPTTERLGYPADARLLIINADDFGMCHSINAATIRALQEGVVTSTSLMIPCPWSPHALQLLKAHPSIPFAVHLTLNSEYTAYRWGPVASKDNVPSLLDEAGYFYTDDRRAELLAQAKLADVEREFRAQIAAVLAAQLAPTHLDFHCLPDGGRSDIFDLTLALALEYGLALRTHGRDSAAKARRAGLPASDHGVLDSFSVPITGKAAHYAQRLRELPPGLSEWAVHPSLGDAEAQAMQPASWQVRKTDFDFLISREARDILDEEEIMLIDYRALQQASSR
jgi:chitin disaccharide deacetylase